MSRFILLILLLNSGPMILANTLGKQLLLGTLIAKSSPHHKTSQDISRLSALMTSWQASSKSLHGVKLYSSWLKRQKDGNLLQEWLPHIRPLPSFRCENIVTSHCQFYNKVIKSLKGNEITGLLLELQQLPAVSSGHYEGEWLYFRIWGLLKRSLYKEALSLVFDKLQSDPAHPVLYEKLQMIYNQEQVSAGNVAIKAL